MDWLMLIFRVGALCLIGVAAVRRFGALDGLAILFAVWLIALHGNSNVAKQ